MAIDANYFFERSMSYMYKGTNEKGELIPRINCFITRGGDLDSEKGKQLLSKAQQLGLQETVNFIRVKLAENVARVARLQIVPRAANGVENQGPAANVQARRVEQEAAAMQIIPHVKHPALKSGVFKFDGANRQWWGTEYTFSSKSSFFTTLTVTLTNEGKTYSLVYTDFVNEFKNFLRSNDFAFDNDVDSEQCLREGTYIKDLNNPHVRAAYCYYYLKVHEKATGLLKIILENNTVPIENIPKFGPAKPQKSLNDLVYEVD